MSGSRLISAFGLAVIFSQISAILSADIAPVVLLGGTFDSPESVDALRLMPQNEFVEDLKKLVGGSPVVVFAKQNFCVEDITQAKFRLENKCKMYYPAVESPLLAFEELNTHNVSKDEKPDTISDGQLFILPFDDLADVPETFTNLRDKSPDLIAAITGASCSYRRSERTRRAVTPRDESEVIAHADRVLFYSGKGIHLKTASDSSFSTLGQPSNVSSYSNSTNSVRLDMIFGETNGSTVTTLRLQFAGTSSKYWYFESIEYESNSTVLTLTSNTTVFFPFNFSYHCTRDLIFYNNDTTFLNITVLQVEIDPKINASSGFPYFSDGYDCIGFTTLPILSGIFVTAILALIMIWAVTMIMDIRTMDRFDDPKAKAITIAVSE